MEPHVTRWWEAQPDRPAQDFIRLTAYELNELTYDDHPGHPVSGDATTIKERRMIVTAVIVLGVVAGAYGAVISLAWALSYAADRINN